ncbi:hypothetical protein [Phycicoccus endophyticus]|uniref:hypothetical protein n=1 Tax=Phycicoccus endophyticus TaxID=1690220 RepID=UPI0021D22599|nr:hypothetical protein [Phycicoccus endophyticus]
MSAASGAEHADLRLLAPAVAAWAVAAATLGCTPGERGAVVLAAGVPAVGVAVASRSGRGREGLASWRGPLALLAVLVVLLQGAALAAGAVREAGGVRELADARAEVTAVVLVTGEPVRVASRSGEDRILRDATARLLTGRGRTSHVRAPVLLTGGAELTALRWHETVRVQGRLGPLERADDRVATLAVHGGVEPVAPPGPWPGGPSGCAPGCARRSTTPRPTPGGCCRGSWSATRAVPRRSSPRPCAPPG